MVKTNAVTSNGYLFKNISSNHVSETTELLGFNKINIQIISVGVVAGSIIEIYASYDGVIWNLVDTTTLLDDDIQEYTAVDVPRYYYRAELKNYTGSGSVSILYTASD